MWRDRLTLCGALLISLISVAVCNAQETVAVSKPRAGDLEQLRKTVERLSAENEQLHRKIAELERRLQSQSIRDRLTQEERRAEDIQAQLLVIAEHEGRLQSQLDEVNEQLRPENIERIQVLGSLRPEDVRESTRRRLSNEQMRIQGQIELLHQSRMRLQSSIAVTDMLILNLRQQLQTVARP